MKKKLKGICAVLLTFVLLLTSCSAPKEEEESEVAMGRYVETKIELPAEFSEPHIMQLEDGSYLLLGTIYNKQEDSTKAHLYESTDNGKSWAEVECQWLKDLTEAAITNLILTDKDDGFVFYSLIDEEIYKQSDVLFAEGKDEEGIAMYGSLDKVARLENGVLTELASFPKTSIGYNANVWEAFLSPAGDLIVFDVFEVISVDTATGEAVMSYPIENSGYSTGTCSVYSESVASLSNNDIMVYNINSGEVTDKLEITVEGYADNSTPGVIAKDKTADAFYYATTKGIYRILGDGSLTEKIVDNSLNSLGMPTNNMTKLFINDDQSFLVNTRENLYFYEFDESIATVPEIELTIYSLNENSTIRQAVGLYQNANPNIKITQELGKTSDETVFADALKTLSTEVLAGNGPDIFVMDGIPVKSYVDKGILLDISDIVQPKVDSGELLENIVNSSKVDGKFYSVPTKFAVPYIQGVGLGEINSIGDILDWYEKDHSNVPLGITRSSMEDLYSFYSMDWFNPDGSLNEQVMLKTLKDLDRLAEIVGEGDDYSIRAIDNNGGVYWGNDGCALTIGSIKALEELSILSSAIDKRGEGELNLLPISTDGSFIPNTVLGINSESKQAQEAKAFLEFALSLEVQEEMFYSGMPVNKAALAANSKEPQSQWGYGSIVSYGYKDSDVEYSLEYVWPKDEFMTEFTSKLGTLSKPIELNRVVERIISDPVYLLVYDRSITPEEAAKAIADDLALYLAEQQ